MTMGLGFSLPWMLVWLLAAIIPPILAWLAVRHPRLVRFGATELVARAAKTQRLTRGGLPLPQTLLRSLMLVAAALAAASPFLPPAATGWRQRPRSDDGRIDSRPTPRRIEIVSGRPLPGRGAADGDGTLAIRLALEALAPSTSSAPTKLSAPSLVSAPTVERVTTDEAARGPPAGQTLIILCAGAMPPTADAERIGSAVAAGAALLVCIGPESIAERDRLRLSAWLDALAGISVEGSLDLADATIEVNADLAMPVDAGLAAAESMIQLADFSPLAGPTVTAAAELTIQAAAGSVATVLARTAPAGRPLLVSKPSGLGIVCVSALPLTLAAADADRSAAWSDLAAWPVFVPLLDRLVEHLIPRAIGGQSPPSSSRQRTGPEVPRSFLPLAPILMAIAIGLAIADRLLSAQATGGSLTPLQKAGHAGTLVSLIGICFLWFIGGWWAPSPRDGRPPRTGRPRPIALVIDISPSMAGCDTPDQAEDLQKPARTASRLESLTGGLTGPGRDGSPLDRIARDRPLMLFTAAADSALLGEYPRDVTAKDLRSLTTVAAAAHASRLGDAIEDILRNGDDSQAGIPPAGIPAVIVIATDGGITAGASWQRAARAAADRGVPLIAVPIGGVPIGDGATGTAAGELPPGFRLTSVTAPRLSRFTEPITIEVRAEAAANGGPLPLAVFAPGDAFGKPIATGMLAHDATPPENADTSCRYFGRLTVPPHGFQTPDSQQDSNPESHAAADSRSVLISPVLCAGTFSAGGGPRSATALTTVPLALTDTPTRVLFIEEVPRYEWRFLEQFVASTAGFEVETCMLATHTTSQRRAGRPLPQSAAEWNHFDVVVLGDLSAGPDAPAAEQAAAWDSLRSAAETDGIGIAWTPGRSWWGSQTDIQTGIQTGSLADNRAGTVGWLPASLKGSASLPGEPPHRVQVTAGGRASGWLPFAADSFHPEVFAVMHPVSLRPTARILATAAGAPAVFVDRQGRGTVLGHLCETYRWRHGNRTEYERFWKQSLLRLAEPHLLGRLFAATIGVRPLAPEVGDRVRIDLVPGHAAHALNGWRAELLVGTTDQTAVRQIPLPEDREPGRTITVMVDGLGAGLHTLRLVPPAAGTQGLPLAPVVRDFIVNEPILEVAGAPAGIGSAGIGPAGIGPLGAAVLAAGGSIVTLDRIATLPDAIASVLPTESSESPHGARGHSTGGSSRASIALANLLMISLVFSAVMAWWQPSTFHRREAS